VEVNLTPNSSLVAPRVGAWIETDTMWFNDIALASHPAWVRGLKLIIGAFVGITFLVAPRVGAWIETLSLMYE